MVENNLMLSAADGARIFLRHWSSGANPKAHIQIAHGMAEHSARYARIAEKLCAAGFDLWANDHRGHGYTADLDKNPPEKGGLLGHCADSGGFVKVVTDLELVSDHIQKQNSSVPLFLFGHSWGSFLAQAYIERNASRIHGVILSGTRGPGGIELKAARLIASLIIAVKGGRPYSALLHALADGSYNKAFKPNRTEFDWLSRDKAEVDAYIRDPLCGFHCSAAFYRDLTEALISIHAKDSLKRIPKELPVLIFSGAADPVGNMGESPTVLVEKYRELGITDLEFLLYPEGRHEMLNEINREELGSMLLSWLERHVS